MPSPAPAMPDRLLAALWRIHGPQFGQAAGENDIDFVRRVKKIDLRGVPEPVREYAKVIIRFTSGAMMADATGVAWHWLTEPVGSN
jgi:hypothetical protein